VKEVPVQKLVAVPLKIAEDRTLHEAAFRILVLLSSGKLTEYSMDWLKAHLAVNEVTIYRSLNALEARGYIVKSSRVIDRRAVSRWRATHVS
jgi:DNA-binding MarR family transcriptional regulator